MFPWLTLPMATALSAKPTPSLPLHEPPDAHLCYHNTGQSWLSWVRTALPGSGLRQLSHLKTFLKNNNITQLSPLLDSVCAFPQKMQQHKWSGNVALETTGESGKVGRGSSSWSHHRKKICGITESFLHHWKLPWSEGFRLSLCVSNPLLPRDQDIKQYRS